MLLLSSCSEDKLEVVDQKETRDSLPCLSAIKISTIISDSGITRYRISTAEWKVFDKTAEPFWLFSKGISFERFNEAYKVDAEMKSDKAVFFERKSLWEFSGNVKVRNIKGETFETEQLFWDENNKRIYSDKKIKITQKTKIINGVGFESNAELTQYVIHHPQGIIPIDETP